MDTDIPNGQISCQIDCEVDIQGGDRWPIYSRLQELGIACRCAAYQPLYVQISHVGAAVQLWSVTQHTTRSNQDLRVWLEHCWHLSQP